MDIAELWTSGDEAQWDRALERYWTLVRPENLDLERELAELELRTIEAMDAMEWYVFLRDRYFRWKYTAPNRRATTTRSLARYIDEDGLDELDRIRRQLLDPRVKDVRWGLSIATRIHGLGTAGASGLLALMYPQHYATVDQFVVKALRKVGDLPEAAALRRMNPESLRATDGSLLIEIVARKAEELCQAFGNARWTPRGVDMVLWTFGR